jgi:hypothetical protein
MMGMVRVRWCQELSEEPEHPVWRVGEDVEDVSALSHMSRGSFAFMSALSSSIHWIESYMLESSYKLESSCVRVFLFASR